MAVSLSSFAAYVGESGVALSLTGPELFEAVPMRVHTVRPLNVCPGNPKTVVSTSYACPTPFSSTSARGQDFNFNSCSAPAKTAHGMPTKRTRQKPARRRDGHSAPSTAHGMSMKRTRQHCLSRGSNMRRKHPISGSVCRSGMELQTSNFTVSSWPSSLTPPLRGLLPALRQRLSEQ